MASTTVSNSYFSRLVAETPTRVWVNNPTIEEIGLALDQGAVGCTTNPAYGGGLLRRAATEVIPIVDACLDASDDDNVVANLVQQRLVSRIVARFRPLYDASGGTAGFVSIQGSPETDMDGDRIWEEAQINHAIGPNATPKIPATLPGLVALERVVEAGWPTIVTEVFSLDQVAAACDVYLRVTARTGDRSPFFMSPITGILGDHLKKLATAQALNLPIRAMELAGVGLARRCAALVAERNYPVTLLFGGARITDDLTGLVGAAHHATINWSTFAEILAMDPPIERTIDAPFEPGIERTLLGTFPDVWKAWELGRLAPEEFEEFGPVQHFRDNFMAGWHGVLTMIADRRTAARADASASARSGR
jgi:transaldolase